MNLGIIERFADQVPDRQCCKFCSACRMLTASGAAEVKAVRRSLVGRHSDSINSQALID